MENLVEIATFASPNEAYVLESILQNEDIKYFLSSDIYSPATETRLMVDSKDIPKAVTIVKESGFEPYLNSSIIAEFLNK